MNKLKIISLLLLIFTCYTNNLLAQERMEDGTIHLKIQRLNDTYIDAYLQHPEGNEKYPLLIMCQGSGYGSMSTPFLGVTEGWKETMGRIVVEKAGVHLNDKGDSLTDVYKENNAVYNRLYDYLRVLQYLRANATWWNGDVYVIGGSEGGLMAGMIASYYPNVKAVAILGFGGGLSFGEVWPIAIKMQQKAAGKNEADILKAEQAVRDSFVHIRKDPSYTKSYDGDDNTNKWWASIIDLRLANSLVDLSIPIYVADGAEDIMSPVISAQKLQELFMHKGKTNLLYTEYTLYDHEFKDKTGKSHYKDIFLDAITWMLSK